MAAAVRLQGETGVQAIAPIKPIHYRQVAASADQGGGKRRGEQSRTLSTMIEMILERGVDKAD